MVRRSAYAVASVVLLLPALCAAQWASEEPPLVPPDDPAKVVAFLMEQPYMFGCGIAAMQHAERIKPYRDAIAAKPAAYQRLIAEAERMPATLDECIRVYREAREQPPPDPLERVPARPGVLARVMRVMDLSALLGRELAEPILKDTFDRALSAHRELRPRIERAKEEWLKRGGWLKAAAPEDRAEGIFLAQIEGTLTGVATHAIVIAQRLNSPVLVVPVLEFYEAGGQDRQSGWPDYVLKCGGHREDVVPRLRKIADDPKTDQSVKFQIERALAAFAKTLS